MHMCVFLALPRLQDAVKVSGDRQAALSSQLAAVSSLEAQLIEQRTQLQQVTGELDRTKAAKEAVTAAVKATEPALNLQVRVHVCARECRCVCVSV